MNCPCPQYPEVGITQANYQALAQTIAAGAKRVKYADKEVEYQSIGDMMRIMEWMKSLLTPKCGGNGGRVVLGYSSGLQNSSMSRENEEVFRR